MPTTFAHLHKGPASTASTSKKRSFLQTPWGQGSGLHEPRALKLEQSPQGQGVVSGQNLLELTAGQSMTTPALAPPIQAFQSPGPSDDGFEHEAHHIAHQLDAGKPLGSPPKIKQVAGGAAGLRGVHPQLQSQIQSARGSGSQLPEGVKSHAEQQLGADFSGVKIHHDAQSQQLNRQLNARAFTTGQDIFFGAGEYRPETAQGRSILNHELTHVVQQCGPNNHSQPSTVTQPLIQRFVLQIGKDDGYTRPMTQQLQRKHPDEEYLHIRNTWDRPRKSIYRPKKKTVRDGNWFKRVNIEVLAELPDDEPVRIVSHGNVKGRVGGYTGAELAAVLKSMGLPSTHTAGIEVHACLPAYAWESEEEQTDPKTNTTKKVQVQHQPHIVELQDALSKSHPNANVSGYENCIFPGYADGYEVSPIAYSLYTKVYQPVMEARPSAGTYQVSNEQLEIINKIMGKDAVWFLKTTTITKGNSVFVDHWHSFTVDITDWMYKKKYYILNARLRRANSVRLRIP